MNSLSGAVISAGIAVHRELGPGLLESLYQKCLSCELTVRGYAVRNEVELPLRYGSVVLEGAYRLDLLVESQIVVETKTVERVLPVHRAQLLTCSKLADCRLGLLINF
ncbi:MAG: GxxExxY protein [Planctomycetes bacterium]|nr:GxxExxY protein [Planctomycetota bacterium]